jgi:3'(2'), 5'-bisphosphate nucleotidase
MDRARQLETAEQIAREAGDILMRYYRGEYEIDTKAGEEPVTEADRAANEHIVARLTQEFPDDGVLAEESAGNAASLVGHRRLWCVDPMDGTKEFINHTDEFAAMIGLVEDGRPVLGVVNQAATGTIYRGIVGDGAEAVTAEATTALRVNATGQSEQLKLICSRSHLPDIVQRMMQELGISEMLRSGSVGLKIGKIGTGICDLYLHPSGGTKLWDAAAPEAILHAAGGRLTDFDGQDVPYDPGHVHNDRGLLASNGVIHAELAERLRGFF